MTRAEFAASIKAKYPKYQSVPDDELVNAMLEKFPQYKTEVQDDKPAPFANSVMANMQQEQARKMGVTPKSEEKEPDTWWGGVFRSLRNQYLTPSLLKTMAPMADPEEVGSHPLRSLATLAIPEGTIGVHLAQEGADRGMSAMRQTLRETQPGVSGEGVLSIPGRAVKSFRDTGEAQRHSYLDQFIPRREPNVTPDPFKGTPSGVQEPHPVEDLLNKPEPVPVGADIGPHRSPSDLRTKESISPADRYAPDTKESSLIDRYMPNEGADIHPTDRVENADLRPEVGKEPESIVDRYMPNKGGEVQPGVEQDIPEPEAGSFGEAAGPMPGEGLEGALHKVAGLDEGTPWITPDAASELRGRVGHKEAARQLGTSPDLVKAQAPRTGPAELPSDVRARLDAAIAAIPTMEGKIEYLNKAPNQLTKDYLTRLLGM